MADRSARGLFEMIARTADDGRARAGRRWTRWVGVSVGCWLALSTGACGSSSDGDAQSSDGGPGGDEGADGSDDGAPGEDGGTPNRPDAYAGPSTSDGLALYPAGERHSPITAGVVRNLQAILANGPSNDVERFIRIGDNLSHAYHLLGCFDAASGQGTSLGDTAYAQPTIDHFNRGDIQGSTPFAYTIDFENFTVSSVLDESGGSSFVQSQIDVARPAFALVSFGSANHAGANEPNQDDWMIVEDQGPPMLELADTLIAQGVVPLLRSVPTMFGPERAGHRMLLPLANALSLAVAQGRQVPFADAHLDTLALGAEGFWDDGFHLEAYMGNACDLSAPALVAGDNVVNRIALEQLHRVKTAVVDEATPPDAKAPQLEGRGTSKDPFVVRALPFTDLRPLEGSSERDDYAACGGSSAANGPERVYRFVVDETTRLRAFVFDRVGSPAQTRVHHFVGGLEQCVSSHFALLELELSPGEHYFVVDAERSDDTGVAPEYAFGLVACEAGDPMCVSDLM